MAAELGRLERVELREIWQSEDMDFTPWLAQESNLALLGSTIGIELELEAQEKNVGPFRADILCRDVDDDSLVLIENQLERTDHRHLGQLLTYAAGLQTVHIIWISAQFTEEHRAALDWLNEITESHFRFFGLEVEAWRIGDSPAAPKFNIISKPNDWSRSVSRAARRLETDELSETKQRYYRYWAGLNEYLQQHGAGWSNRKPRAQHWFNFAVGRSGFKLVTTGNTRDNRLRVELFISGDSAKAYFHLLKEARAEIESEIGAKLDWEELPERKGARVALYRESTSPATEKEWPEQFAWFADYLEKFRSTFSQRVRVLDENDWSEPDEEVSA